MTIDIAAADALLTTTRGVRRRLDFDKPVDPKVLRDCIRIALQAPVGSPAWPRHFIVVTDAAKRKGVADLYRKACLPYIDSREALADSPVHVIFGVEDLTGQLSRLAHVDHSPSADDILREVALVTGAEPEPETDASMLPEPETDASMLPVSETDASMLPVSDLRVEHLVIHHVEHLHIHRHFPDEPGAEVA